MTRTPDRFLRLVLTTDAALSLASGLGLIVGAGAAAAVLGLPAALLTGAGVVLVAYAAFLVAIVRAASIGRRAVLAAIAINVVWGLECLMLPALDWVAPTAIGIAFLVTQAVTVAVMADLMWLGLRRTAAVPA